MTELEMMEAVIEEYQAELYRVYLTLIAWDTPQSRKLAHRNLKSIRNPTGILCIRIRRSLTPPHLEPMLKLSRLAICITAMFFSASPAIAQSEQWVRITTNNDDDVWYVDKASIKNRGRYRFYWQSIVYGEPVNVGGKNAVSQVSFNSVDCKTKLRRIRDIKSYDQELRVVGVNRTIRDEVEAVPPRSLDMHVVNYVCSR
jgi:hypothetical protein